VRYETFLRLREPVWNAFEASLDGARRGRTPSHAQLEALTDAYRQVLHDHALASHRYAGTGAARRLRSLALAGTAFLTTTETRRRSPFFSRTFPRAFRAHLPWFAAAAALFVVSAALGWTLAFAEPGVGLRLLGPQAEQGLREGKLWTDSLFSTIPPALGSSFIATNNMSVAITGFAGGVPAGLGSLYVLLMNGFMLGAIVACTAHYGLASRLLEFVSAHGPLEITLILVSAGAGLAMGHAIVAPHDRPRRVALAEAGRGAVVVLAGCMPWFLLLGVVESFVSPSAALAVPVKAALGLTLLATFLVLSWNPALPSEETSS
jgi:uncharacterized membrane protein SpoIIM required for sporulation